DALAGVRRGATAHTGGNGSGVALDTLRRAAQDGRSVWIGFVNGHGVAVERVLEPLSIGSGVVEGRDSMDGALHRVPLHRITSIALVDD
ncbi:MAG: helicase-associated domain-containing protein, partial [Pseudonocardia sp.]